MQVPTAFAQIVCTASVWGLTGEIGERGLGGTRKVPASLPYVGTGLGMTGVLTGTRFTGVN